MRRVYAFLFFLCLISATASAQGLAGYVLTLAGDTLRGTVVEQQNHQRIALYTPGNRAPQLFWAGQVRGYGLRGQSAIRARAVRLASGSDSVCFVMPVQLGRASLYAYNNETGLLLLPPAADTLLELTAINWHVLLNRYLAGCSTLDHSNNRIIQLSFSERNVRQVFMEYNQCLDPTWKPTPSPTRTIWRNGLGVRISALHQLNDTGDELARNSLPVGLEWVHVRASGLQTIISGDYYSWSRQSALTASSELPNTDEQVFFRQKTLDIIIGVSQRIGRPGRLALLPGFGVGGLSNLHSETKVKQRPSGSNAPLQTSSVYRDGAWFLAHIDATLGTVLPLGAHQEVRLTAFYQQYLSGIYSRPGTIGLQLAYNWFRK